MYIRSFWIAILVLGLISCGDDVFPKPKGVLRLEYPKANYQVFNLQQKCPFEFQVNTNSKVNQKAGSCDLNIHYPKMKATIYISYKKVQGNIRSLLRDAQKLTFEHTVKADNIASTPFVNQTNRVYGMFYQVYGNAASQAQFYATDSISHFISGSVYFKALPNYDSIQPATHYLEKDVRKIMETLQWK
ncbi:gliding motility lipoprotein GldD [Capnocytophaga canimorsus]|uniref:gliding motility lipoprotein GldD n=1 Tax=Capnocytophaga canimorsus TaxID=28188 RepID=UPI001AC48D5C|nr:gliding motility lipoprotein GldD [Capnocytophaga canimorsus]GIM57510.1 gliding motility lipoprotein GldD [Capnocytophaga canimorsus]